MRCIANNTTAAGAAAAATGAVVVVVAACNYPHTATPTIVQYTRYITRSPLDPEALKLRYYRSTDTHVVACGTRARATTGLWFEVGGGHEEAVGGGEMVGGNVGEEGKLGEKQNVTEDTVQCIMMHIYERERARERASNLGRSRASDGPFSAAQSIHVQQRPT